MAQDRVRLLAYGNREYHVIAGGRPFKNVSPEVSGAESNNSVMHPRSGIVTGSEAFSSLRLINSKYVHDRHGDRFSRLEGNAMQLIQTIQTGFQLKKGSTK